jgi:hypothetical protein
LELDQMFAPGLGALTILGSICSLHFQLRGHHAQQRREWFLAWLQRYTRMAHGYARVSTQDQNLDLQVKALTKAGCKKVFDDKISGTRAERPGLATALAMLREGEAIPSLSGNSTGWAVASRILSTWSANFMGRGFSSRASPTPSTPAPPLADFSFT